MSPSVFTDVLISLAKGDPSMGFAYGVIAVHAFHMGFYDERACLDVWGDDPDVLIASPYIPTGKAKKVEGGYISNGRWPFSSGSDNCALILLGPSVEVVLYDQIRSNVDIGATQILFRIAQEALANAAKHADATTLTISLSETKTDIIVEIDDDGVGGDPENFSKYSAGHLGIRSMTERARSLGGRCEIMSSPGHGTSVFIRIPRNAMVPVEPFYT